jgi:hypothetical protein
LTHLASNEFKISGALRVAIPSAVLSASFVVGLGRYSAIGRHISEVECTIKSAGEVRDVNIKCKLLVEQIELLVVGAIGQQVEACSNVHLGRVCDEVDFEGISAGRHAVGTAVISTVKCTVLSASNVIGAKRCVPGIAGIAVGRAAR